VALKDSAAYNPRASCEETGKKGEETSGLLSPHDQGRLGRWSAEVKDKTSVVITWQSSQQRDDDIPEISKTPEFMRERWGQELKIWAATRMGKIWAHLRCFHGRQLLILLASRKGMIGGGACWVFLGNKEGRGGGHPFYTKGKKGSNALGFRLGHAGVGQQFTNFTSITIRSPGPPFLKINA
jgi:hypothetical protein